MRLLSYCTVLLEKFIVSFLIFLILFYKLFISPLLGSNCRFIPSCSVYAVRAFKKKGFLKGSLLTIKRILSCHPFSKPKVDDI